MTDTSDRELAITRVFDAPRELVFRAWTDPQQLTRWWGPAGFSTPSVALEVAPGGAWRTCIRSSEDGRDYWSRGHYTEVVPPERLAFTFRWEDEDSPETVVTVSFDDQGGGKTRMTFRQAVFASAEERDDHESGWSECFDDLAAMLVER
jgi:uncharacterized protein YndB with AHSA1/START domain